MGAIHHRPRAPDAAPARRNVAPAPLAVIVELDGTLNGCVDAQASAWVDAIRAGGYPAVALPSMRRLIGMGRDRILRHVLGLSADRGEAHLLAARQSHIFCERYLPDLAPRRDARALLLAMRAHGMRLVALSTAGDEECIRLLHAAGIHDLFDAGVTAADAASTLPSPAPLAAVAEWSRIPAARVAVLATTPYAAFAARRAHMPAVGLRCAGWHDRAFIHSADVYDDPSAVLQRYATSLFAPPPARPTAAALLRAATARLQLALRAGRAAVLGGEVVPRYADAAQRGSTA